MSDDDVRSFHVTAHWDQESGVFYSRTDIPGLVVETLTFEEFVDLVNLLTPDLLAENLPELKGAYRITIEARLDFLKAVA
jgi:Domain of unknown function (DUF1902)